MRCLRLAQRPPHPLRSVATECRLTFQSARMRHRPNLVGLKVGLNAGAATDKCNKRSHRQVVGYRKDARITPLHTFGTTTKSMSPRGAPPGGSIPRAPRPPAPTRKGAPRARCTGGVCACTPPRPPLGTATPRSAHHARRAREPLLATCVVLRRLADGSRARALHAAGSPHLGVTRVLHRPSPWLSEQGGFNFCPRL